MSLSQPFTIDGWPSNLTEQWKPQQAPHVEGRYEVRTADPATGMPEPQAFEARCLFVSESGEVCGQRWRGSCSSGRVRQNILSFAMRHLHRDPFAR